MVKVSGVLAPMKFVLDVGQLLRQLGNQIFKTLQPTTGVLGCSGTFGPTSQWRIAKGGQDRATCAQLIVEALCGRAARSIQVSLPAANGRQCHPDPDGECHLGEVAATAIRL